MKCASQCVGLGPTLNTILVSFTSVRVEGGNIFGLDLLTHIIPPGLAALVRAHTIVYLPKEKFSFRCTFSYRTHYTQVQQQ